MADRLTRWEGHNPDGSPRAVLVKREGLWPENMQEALAKLADFEDLADGECSFCCKDAAPIFRYCDDDGKYMRVIIRGGRLCVVQSEITDNGLQENVEGRQAVNFCPVCGRYLDG